MTQTKNHAVSKMDQGASLRAVAGIHVGATINQHYKVEHWRRGVLLWIGEFDNLVVTAGLNKYLDATLKTGLASPLWYVFLKNTGTAVAADTMASHASWTENQTYTEANRVTWTPGAVSAGSVDNSASKANFSINGSTTIFGAGMADQNTKGGTTGVLLGAGDFGASRAVLSGDTLAVTVTCSLT